MYYEELQLSLIQNIRKHYAYLSFRTKLYALYSPSGNVQTSHRNDICHFSSEFWLRTRQSSVGSPPKVAYCAIHAHSTCLSWFYSSSGTDHNQTVMSSE